MNLSSRRFFSEWCPPALWRLARRCRHGRVFSGDYSSWPAAVAASRGYDAPAIFERTIAAARAVRDGRAAWERDSVVFHHPPVPGPLLAALLRVAAVDRGELNLVDFGGALGSTWWQCRSWLEGLPRLAWNVIDQSHVVAAGQREFTVGPLRFFESLEAARAAIHPTTILLSSVLPYLQEPHRVLSDIVAQRFRHVVIDRTGFVTCGRDRLTVQRVPRSIYDASYPCWFFDRENLLRPFAQDYRIIATWEGFDQADIAANYQGVYLERVAR